ncbi:MAG: hypothetical protein WCA85_22075 [Paraburkholderia sp.]|uniref:hypothetical protein n=1 Tax=Paraburkholderia sp. TaxID=1926495 RepID=UPI003C67EA95
MNSEETVETPPLKTLERAFRHGADVLGLEGSEWLGADNLTTAAAKLTLYWQTTC